MDLVTTSVGRRCCRRLEIKAVRQHSPTRERFRGIKRVVFRMKASHELWHDTGRETLPRRLEIKTMRQHSPTKERFRGTKRVVFLIGEAWKASARRQIFPVFG